MPSHYIDDSNLVLKQTPKTLLGKTKIFHMLRSLSEFQNMIERLSGMRTVAVVLTTDYKPQCKSDVDTDILICKSDINTDILI